MTADFLFKGIFAIGVGCRWVTGASVTSLDEVLKQRAVQRLVGNYLRSNLDVVALLTKAWEARDKRLNFRSWFEEVGGADRDRA